MSDEPKTEPVAEMVYVVQAWMRPITEEQREAAGLPETSGDMPPMWVDIATVKVPPRTKRSTVIKKALAEANIAPSADGSKPRLRALDVDSFEVHEPEAHTPPMEWRL